MIKRKSIGFKFNIVVMPLFLLMTLLFVITTRSWGVETCYCQGCCYCERGSSCTYIPLPLKEGECNFEVYCAWVCDRDGFGSLVSFDGSCWMGEELDCPIEEIYGEDSEEVVLLRYLRDEVLSQTSEGQEIIRLYYQWSPMVVRAIEEDEEFKEEVKETIDGILPTLRVAVE